VGLFGFLKKAVGGIAKAGLGAVTGGVSNQVFDYLGQRKKQQYLSSAASQILSVAPRVKKVRMNTNTVDTFSEFGEDPTTRKARLRAQRLANLAKARAKRRAADQ